MKIIEKDIDLLSLRSKCGYLIPGANYELIIIRYYKMLPTTGKDNLINICNNYICNKLNGTNDVAYEYSDLTNLVDEKIYNDIFSKFLGMLETILLHNSTPNVVDIEYVSCVDISTFKFKFKYTYLE